MSEIKYGARPCCENDEAWIGECENCFFNRAYTTKTLHWESFVFTLAIFVLDILISMLVEIVSIARICVFSLVTDVSVLMTKLRHLVLLLWHDFLLKQMIIFSFWLISHIVLKTSHKKERKAWGFHSRQNIHDNLLTKSVSASLHMAMDKLRE